MHKVYFWLLIFSLVVVMISVADSQAGRKTKEHYTERKNLDIEKNL